MKRKILSIILASVMIVGSVLCVSSCGDGVEYDENGNTFFSIQLETKSGKPVTYSATLYKTMNDGSLQTEQFYGVAPDIQTTYAVQLDLVIVKNDSTDILYVKVYKGRKVVAQASIQAVGGNATLVAK